MPAYAYKPADRLLRDIESAVPGVTSTQTLSDGSLRVNYPADLSPYSKDVLDQLLMEQGYIAVPSDSSVQLTSIKLVDGAGVDVDWTALGGGLLDPSAFTKDASMVFGRLVGQMLTFDGAVELRLIESQGKIDVEVLTATLDTAGEWEDFTLDTTVELRLGQSVFRVEARFNTASAAKVQFVSLALLEVSSSK